MSGLNKPKRFHYAELIRDLADKLEVGKITGMTVIYELDDKIMAESAGWSKATAVGAMKMALSGMLK